MNDSQMEKATLRNIMIWLHISLAFILYFVVMSLYDMQNQKSSILYAKYGTSKQVQINQ